MSDDRYEAVGPNQLWHLDFFHRYMPIRSGKKEKTTLVYDAFLRLDRDELLRVGWENVELTAQERRLFEVLAELAGGIPGGAAGQGPEGQG